MAIPLHRLEPADGEIIAVTDDQRVELAAVIADKHHDVALGRGIAQERPRVHQIERAVIAQAEPCAYRFPKQFESLSVAEI